jgi:hypothetical protein
MQATMLLVYEKLASFLVSFGSMAPPRAFHSACAFATGSGVCKRLGLCHFRQYRNSDGSYRAAFGRLSHVELRQYLAGSVSSAHEKSQGPALKGYRHCCGTDQDGYRKSWLPVKNAFCHLFSQSLRNATIGSTRVAARAGI